MSSTVRRPGPIISPSGIVIVYACVMGESVAALFLAGIASGILVGLGLMNLLKPIADMDQRVTHAAATENKRLGAVLEHIKGMQDAAPPKAKVRTNSEKMGISRMVGVRAVLLGQEPRR